MTGFSKNGSRANKASRHVCPTVAAGLAILATAMALLVGAGAFAQTAQQGPAVNYIPEDARISGKVVRLFTEGSEQTAVVLGDFNLTMGKHHVRGRDAVLWIGESKVGNATFRNITIYIEGGAQIIEPTGATTNDRTMLVTLHQQGELLVSGASVDEKPLSDFPLYKSAMAARKAEAERIVASADGSKAAVATGPTTRAATTGPAMKVAVVEKPKPIRPVTFEAKQGGTSEVRGARRITIAREVYLGIGVPEYHNSMEITCQSAVLFSERRPPKDATVPWSPRFGGAGTNLPGSKDMKETLVGAYLEGDVIIRSGERVIRSPAAYYDFMTDRAIIVEPVVRTVQEQRNIPIYVRAEEARGLSAREMQFRNAQISSSDLYTPSYSVGAKTMKLTNTTPYDEEGVKVGPQGWRADMEDVTLNVENVPFFWIPKAGGDLEQESTALRTINIGSHGAMGSGVSSQWHLFRLLGLVPPSGFDARLELDYYSRGPMIGSTVKYDRDTYSGYASAYGMINNGEDQFGDDRQNIAAPSTRGRVMARHKQILPQDWEIQFEVSYLSDVNYLEEFFPDEYYTGKEQETLIYAKQQRDNWAFTALMQYRLNSFQTQTESAPDLGFDLVGQPLADGAMTFFSNSRAGLKRFVPGNDDANYTHESDWMGRLDSRNEVDAPIKLGPVNLVPYAVGRGSYWGDSVPGGSDSRLFGQAGVKASTSLWRTYKDVSNRMLDVNGLKHVITPEAVAFISGASGNGDDPNNLYPMDPDVEQHVNKLSGGAIGVTQRLLTKRGPEGERQQADWMRLKVMGGYYDKQVDPPQSDGRFFWYSPESSIARNFINTEYTWNISDATVFMADMNYDVQTGTVGRSDIGIAVTRDPRLRYYLGWRKIREINSSVITAGADYQINRKYSISMFEQYDMDYDNGRNLGTSITLTRKLERWYVALTVLLNQRDSTGGTSTGVMLSVWPEGVPEFRIGSNTSAFNSSSTKN